MTDILNYTVIDGIKCYSPSVAKDYSDYPDHGFDLTEENASSSFWVSSRNRLFKTMVKENLKDQGATRFLEIGCGTGNFIEQIQHTENLSITGSEVYIKGLLYAKKNLPNIEFIQLDISEGKVSDGFDFIAAFDVIEHIENDVAAVKNMTNMLTSGGTLILSVPQHQFLWSNLDEIVGHKRRYSKRDLLELCIQNNLEVQFVTSFLFTLFPIMLLNRVFDKKLKHSSSSSAFKKRVTFSRVSNFILDAVMRVDELLIRNGVSLPFGGTLIIVAKKPQN